MLTLSAEAALQTVRDRTPAGGRVFVAGCAGEPLLFADALARAPALAAGLSFAGVFIPGVNRTDYASFHPDARSEVIFLSPERRETFERGRTRFRPQSYVAAWRWFETAPVDAALVVVSAPDRGGAVSLGVSADFAPAVLARKDVFKIAHVNPGMPAPAAAPRYKLSEFDVVVEGARALVEYRQETPGAATAAVAAEVARLVGDGATLQFGLGALQPAALRALATKRGLRIHSGMVSDGLLGAIEAGAIRDAPGAVTTGVALGTPALYERAGRDPRFRFMPVGWTHAHATLAGVRDFVAINSVVEVDLFGQANAEFIDGRQISGGGGLVDFLRGAAAAPGGKPVVALASTAKSGAVSRIVPRIDAHAVTLARADIGFLVTERGAADLRGLDIDERARAIIALADPGFRRDLSDAWSRLRSAM